MITKEIDDNKKENQNLFEENKQMILEKEERDNEEEKKNSIEYRLEQSKKIYKDEIGSKASFMNDFALELNLQTPSNKNFLNAISSSKIQLPDIKRLKIDKLADNDDTLDDFLTHCIPSSLELLCINNSHIDANKPIKADFYSHSLAHALQPVTEEIYFETMIFGKEAFETVVKASCNSQRLIVKYSNIEAEQEFDFYGPSYKINFLSFIF
jgi:hypothetical protein